MFHYFCSRDAFRTMRIYIRNWQRSLNNRFWFVAYDKLPRASAFKGGVFIGSDLERIDRPTTAAMAELWDALALQGEAVKLLNHPLRTLRRPELLRALRACGTNDFNAYALDEPRDGIRYPVFVRSATEHDGTYTPLLDDPRGLSEAIERLRSAGRSPESLLIVEYRDVRDDAGIVHKYSAFRVGDRIIPRHLFFGRDWCLKKADLTGNEFAALERDYVSSNPHEAELRRIFELAHVDYGRIDYAMTGGRIVVWEINTNPTILTAAHLKDRPRAEVHRWFSQEFHKALVALMPVHSPSAS